MEAILQLRPYLGKENFFLNWDLFFFSLFLFERLGMVVSCLRSNFIILYRLCYKLRQCKPGSVYFYSASLAFKKKKKSGFRSVGKGNNLSVQEASLYLCILSAVKFVCPWWAWDCVPLLSSVCFCRRNNWGGNPAIPISPFTLSVRWCIHHAASRPGSNHFTC